MAGTLFALLEAVVDMICPYIVTRRIVVQSRHEYNDGGANTASEQVEINEAVPIKCTCEDCGAWANGRCRYNGDE